MRAFLAGRAPLSVAFWKYAMLYGTALNVAATVAFLAAQVAELPNALLIALFLLPVPYSLLAVLGVWRSASAHSEPAQYASWARIAVLGWAVLMIFV